MSCIEEYLKQTFRNSSLKFFHYIVIPRRHPIERAFWLVCCCCAGLGAGCLSLSTWRRYQKSPTVLSIERDFLNWNTTLPAFTVCPLPRVDESAVRRVASTVYPDDVERGVKFLSALANWTYPHLGQIPDEHRFNPSHYQQLLMDIRYNFTYTIPQLATLKNTTKLHLSLTEMGICFSLNSQVAQYLDPKYWFSGDWSLKEPTNLIHGNLLDVAELSTQVSDMNAPFNIYFHGSEETVDASANLVIHVGPQAVLYIDTLLIETYSTEATRKLSPFQRKCRFQEESNLDNSPVYSYRLCRAECRMRLSLQLCGCVPYFYRNTGKYKICGSSGMNCLTKYKDRLLKLREGWKKETCDCLQNCNSVDVKIYRALQASWNTDSVVRFALNKYPKLRLKRDIVFSFGDLLVQMGGAAGLCFGWSVLSVFELSYFLTFRLYFFLRNKG